MQTVSFPFQWHCPSIGLKGCLHLVLFIAFLIMFLTSFVWVVWCQTSNSKAAVKERNSPEVKYAYLLNGVFMMTALTGMILDSFRHLRKYLKKVHSMNQEFVILEYPQSDKAGNGRRLRTRSGPSGYRYSLCSQSSDRDPETQSSHTIPDVIQGQIHASHLAGETPV